MFVMFKKSIDPHNELFNLKGEERYTAIRELTSREVYYICGYHKKCEYCPMALYFESGRGLCCKDASEYDVKSALRYGAEFTKKEDNLNEKFF